MSRLPVKKTYKLFIGGAFPRSESGRTYEAEGQNIAHASRKDVRDAVRAARARPARLGGGDRVQPRPGALPPRRDDRRRACRSSPSSAAAGTRSSESIDRIVWYAGWADKLPQVLGGSNPVAGPYFNFTIPEPTGVVAVLAPDEPPLLGLVTRLLPPLVGGNAVVAVASETRPLAAVELAEAIATSDSRAASSTCSPASAPSSAPILASHMDVNALDVAARTATRAELERLAAENVKRVVHGRADVQSPWEIASFLELKTVWHPIGQ